MNIETQQKQDLYTWRAYYGTDHLDESEATSGFLSVDQSRITHVALLNHLGEVVHLVSVPSGAQGVFFRRRAVVINLTDESSTPKETIHCIGWKRGEQAVYQFILESGCTLLSDDLQAV